MFHHWLMKSLDMEWIAHQTAAYLDPIQLNHSSLNPAQNHFNLVLCNSFHITFI